MLSRCYPHFIHLWWKGNLYAKLCQVIAKIGAFIQIDGQTNRQRYIQYTDWMVKYIDNRLRSQCQAVSFTHFNDNFINSILLSSVVWRQCHNTRSAKCKGFGFGARDRGWHCSRDRAQWQQQEQGQGQVATPSRVASVCGCHRCWCRCRCRCSWSCIRGIIYAFKQSKAPGLAVH